MRDWIADGSRILPCADRPCFSDHSAARHQELHLAATGKFSGSEPNSTRDFLADSKLQTWKYIPFPSRLPIPSACGLAVWCSRLACLPFLLVELPHSNFLPVTASRTQILACSAHLSPNIRQYRNLNLTPSPGQLLVSFGTPASHLVSPLSLGRMDIQREDRGVRRRSRRLHPFASRFAMGFAPHAPIHTWLLVFNIKKHCQLIIA